MINNRQGGRRRGRGGQRGQNLGGQPGNRQDNRQRGNAAQLLEKYKSMARDAQLAGDRVQTEYFLQFADHYFRVLSESRARFEDQNQGQRRNRDDEGDEDSEGDSSFNETDQQHGDDELVEAGDGAGSDDDERQEQRERPARGPRRQRGEREPRQFNRDERSAADNDEPARARAHLNGGDSLPLDALPPAIGSDEVGEEAAAQRPRRRSRSRPAEGDEEIAPAA